MSQCEDCAYYAYDEEYDEYICGADMDQDDYARLMGTPAGSACPYFRDND